MLITKFKTTCFAQTRNLLLASASVPILMLSQTALAQSSATQDEVIVTGIRHSLEEAAELKRGSARIVDAIVAEDIGKLPDNNIAEALQRITGVSISTDFGVGEGVSIRGLPQNRVEINGRSTMGDGRDGISLEDFPSSFLKSVEVIKTPTADMIEGSLGGTVRMNTMRPLDLTGLTAAGSFDYEYADKTEHWAPIANGTLGNVWELGGGSTFGVIGSISYQDRELRQDLFHQRVQLYDIDIPGQAANTPEGTFVIGDQNTVEQDVEKRKRTAYDVSLQWAPASDKGQIYADMNWTERDGYQNGSSILDVGGNSNITFDENTSVDSHGRVEGYTLNGAFVIPKTFSQFRNTDSNSFAFGGDWDFTDHLNVSAEFATASSSSYEPDLEFNLRPINRTNWEAWVAGGGTNFNSDRSAFGLRHTIDATVLRRGDELPSVTFSDGRALLDPENLALRRFQYDDRKIDNDEDAYRFDVEYDDGFGLSWLTNLKAGARFTSSEYELNHSRFQASNLYRNAYRADGTPFALWIDQFDDMFPGSFTTVNHHNSFTQTGLSGRNDLLNYRIFDGQLLGSDPAAVYNMIQSAFAGAFYLDGDGNPTIPIAGAGSLQDNLIVQEGSFSNIKEDTQAFYASADLEFGDFNAVVGGRYVTTDLDSTVLDSGTPKTESNSYNDFLPSVNATYSLSDDTKLRFAFAKVMRRADYGFLSSATSIDGNVVTASQGSFDLDPYRTTQYDFSAEHYFGNGGLISAAVFYKDVKSFFKDETTCVANPVTATEQNVTEFQNVCLLNTAGVDNPTLEFSNDETFVTAQRDAGLTGIRTSKRVNGEKGKVKGFELGYQQPLTFLPGMLANLAINANYTYADSEQPNGNNLLDISKHSLNTQLYWENDTFQARVAYNYRSKFLDTEEEKRIESIGALGLGSTTNTETDPLYDPTAGNNWRDARGQLDASAAWNINDHLSVVANGTNLLGAPSVYSHELGSSYRYVEADRRFALGIRAKY